MEGRSASVWICLLGAGLALALSVMTSKALPRPPRLLGCVFLNRANVTCRWEAGGASATRYTLQIQRIPGAVALTTNTPLKTFTCTTSDTSCTADLARSSVRFTFCVTITAHGLSSNTSSDRRCQPGRIEMMLPPATLNSVKPVNGTPQCLHVIWSRTLSEFSVSDTEIKNGSLNSQIEVTEEGQLDSQVTNVTVKDYSFPVCLLRPGTLYAVRLCHRYRGPESPWSPWSNAQQGRTAEDVPSAAPAFWRQVTQTDRNGWRLTSLLWKALPHVLANGRLLFYNLTCQTESSAILNDQGTCRDLHPTRTSCTFLLPAERCSCALSASNSAGTSPQAQIWLLGASETEPPSPRQLTARPLDDNSVNVSWTAPANRSVSGYVLEYFAVREKDGSVLHWERLNSSQTTFVITEGVKPMERYAVSVKALYSERWAGKNRTLHIYTRQAVPSAGPVVEVQQITGGRLELSWSPVPVELLRGFIRNYTLHYTAAKQPHRSVFVRGNVQHYTLEGLSPGNYDIFMQAITDAGTGAAGPIANVHIGSEEISKMMYVVLSLMVTGSLALALMACLAQKKIKRKLCQFVPDPSNSSLVHWIPKTTSQSMKQPWEPERPQIANSEVILFCENEPLNYDLDQITENFIICNQTYSSLLDSSGFRVPQSVQMSKKLFSRGPLRKPFTTDLSPSPILYSSVIFSHTLKNPAAPLLSPSPHQSCDCRHVSDVTLLLGGGSAASPKHQSSTPFSVVHSVSPSTAVHPQPADVHSPKHIFPQSLCSSGLSLQPDTFIHPHLSSLLPPLFVDLSYCPAECDNHTSPAVC
ncbi:interleukin-6 receptor subunit beta-like [Platichthys flesus]|uniref:interleukin-6 receptor subunit beta-like n=1 Tax=Platichthys flesus TaxID=8260 RepID=UPI002DBDAE5B|nr:interleukin-6 receptor subunit beta-like [Platichthys flesus]XP_062253900.1 interleukin-6 receptor subunit beta-like [Platichthys flesus]